jgi:NlpE N-terminal domain
MTWRTFAALWLTILAGCASQQGPLVDSVPWYPSANEQGDPIFAVFEGRIPCAGRQPAGCNKIKVGLAIYRDSRSRTLTSYKLTRVYVAETEEGHRVLESGTMQIARGIKLDSTATVYRLDENVPEEFSAYWAIGTDILFILDSDLSPRAGTAGWSYVLNRTR